MTLLRTSTLLAIIAVSALALSGPAFAQTGDLKGQVTPGNSQNPSIKEKTADPNTIGDSTTKEKLGTHEQKPVVMRPGQNYQVIQFKPGTATLTEGSKKMLQSLVTTAKKSGEIEQIHVAAWADKGFPKGENAELKDADKKIAEGRAEAVENYVNDQLKVSDVKTYSMAEKSNWFARTFNTDEAELKDAFTQKDRPANIDPEEFNVVRGKGGPSKAVILVEMEN